MRKYMPLISSLLAIILLLVFSYGLSKAQDGQLVEDETLTGEVAGQVQNGRPGIREPHAHRHGDSQGR